MEDYSDGSIQRKIKRMKILKKTGKFILTSLIVIIILVNMMILLKKHIDPDVTPDILGYKAFAISKESQNTELDINDGDLIFVKKNIQVNVGDIIIYNDGENIKNDEVIDKIVEGSSLQYIIKKGGEEKNIERQQVEGIYLSKIPKAGGIALFLNNIWVSGALVLLIIAMQCDSIKLENGKKMRKQKRLNYENRKYKKESI